jgi:hypothetical protein
MMQELEGYKERIRTMEEEVQYYKGERTHIHEFKTCIEVVIRELHNLAKEMYASLQSFQKKDAQIMV